MPEQAKEPRRAREGATTHHSGGRRAELSSTSVRSAQNDERRDQSPLAYAAPSPLRVPSEMALLAMRLVPGGLRNSLWNALGYRAEHRAQFLEKVSQYQPFYALQIFSAVALPQEAERARIAFVLSRSIPEEVMRSLNQWGIKERSAVFDIASAAVSVPVTPLFFPKWRSRVNLPKTVAALPLCEVDKARLFALALRSRPLEAPGILSAIRITSPEARLIAARAVATQGDLSTLFTRASPLIDLLTPEWLPDIKHRRSIAEVAAAKAPSKLSEIVLRSSLEERDDRLPVVMAAASSGRDFPFSALPALGITDEPTVLKVFEAVAKRNCVNAIGALAWQGTLSESSRMRILEKALTNEERILDPRLLADAVVLNGVSDASEQTRLALLIGRKAGWGLGLVALRRLGIQSAAERVAYACEVAKYCAPPPSDILLSKLGLSRRDEVMPIFFSAVSGGAPDVIAALAGDYPVLDREDRLEIYRALVAARPDGLSSVARTAPGLTSDALLAEVVSVALLRSQERSVGSEDLVGFRQTSAIVRGLSGEVSEGEVHSGDRSVLGRIRLALRRLENLCPDLSTRRSLLAEVQEPLSPDAATVVASCAVVLGSEEGYIASPKECLEIVFGIEGLQGTALSSRQFRALAEVLGSIYGPWGREMPRVCDLVSISPEVWRYDFRGALDCIIGRAAVFSIDPTSFEAPISVTFSSRNDARTSIARELGAALQRALGISYENGALNLAQQWGDISPIAILLGRFRRSFEREVPALASVVERILNGTFLDNRYDPAHDQFPGFSDSMLARWRENPHRLTLARAGEGTEASRNHRRLSAHERYSELLASSSDDAEIAILSRSLSLENIEPLARLKQGEFSDWYRRLEHEQPRGAMKHIVASIGVLLRHERLEEARSFLRSVATIKARIGIGLPEQRRRVIISNIDALSDVLKERSVEKGRGYLIFTTITDDPKLLLTSGDLVPTASCQNYKTGSQIQTLLSYVMDGNIKACVSFVIAESLVRKLLKVSAKSSLDVEDLQVAFDPPKLELTLTTADGASVTVPLGKAIRRRILRTGQRLSDGTPCLFAERPYEVLHAVSSKIESEEDALLLAVEKRCGFMPAVGSVEYPATLNPLGAYTDFAQAVMSGPYTLFFDKESFGLGS